MRARQEIKRRNEIVLAVTERKVKESLKEEEEVEGPEVEVVLKGRVSECESE